MAKSESTLVKLLKKLVEAAKKAPWPGNRQGRW